MAFSPRGRPSNRAKLARVMSTKEFDSSNATSNAFLGGKQKEWMSFNPNASVPPSLAPPTKTPSEPHLTAEQYKATRNHDFSVLPFPPGYDRGRFPRERRRRGGTKTHSSRLTPSVISGSTPPVICSPMAVEGSPIPTSKGASDNANNLLPSPSPSVATRRTSATVIDLEDLEDEAAESQATAISPTRSTELDDLLAKFGYEELKKRFAELERPPSVPVPHAISPASNRIAQTIDPIGPLPITEDVNRLNSETIPVVQGHHRTSSATSRRPPEVVSEPRKRLQSFPEVIPTAAEPIHRPAVQHTLSPNASLEAEMQSFYRKALQRLHLTNVPDRPGVEYERSRIGLLRVACWHSDFFYLRLHQLFCVDAMYRRTGRVTPFLEDEHRRGLEVLSYLLVPNENLSADAIEWFSSFPLPWEILHPSRPAFHVANMEVMNCLRKLSSNWKVMQRLCADRDYPPLVEDMIVFFDVESFTFQQVIFLALLREIWKGPQDHCYQLTEEVFPKDYKETMLRRSRKDPEDANKAYNQFVIGEFQSIALCHGNHMQQQALQRNMPPPQQGQTGLERTNTNGNHHDRRTLSLNHTQRRLQSSSATPALSPSSINPYAQPSVIPGPLRQGPSPYRNLVVNTATNMHDTPFAQSPTTLQSPQNQSMSYSYHSSSQPQNQQTRASQSVPAIPLPSSSMPSEIIESLAQSAPRNLPAHQILPSNAPNRDSTHTQQHSTTQFQQPVQSHSPYTNPYSPLQPGSWNGTQQQRIERSSQPRTTQTPQHNLTHFIRANPNLTQSQPNPTRSALHQAHVRSPILSSFGPEGQPINMKKNFRFIKHVIMPPGEVSSRKQYLKWDFNIERALADTLARDTPGSYGSPPLRTLVPGSRLCRIRCIKLNKSIGMPSQNEWVVSDNVWHSSTAIGLNGNALEIRKKSHHGKDLPIDATPYVREGMNSISTAVIGFSENSITRYAIGVEIIEVIEEQLIKYSIPVLPWREARKRMIDRSSSLDPEVLIIDSQMIIDLKDPFSAQVFVVPVRGTYCRHNQCFDRDIFLETRNSKNTKEPCGPDEFRCPICGSDARPQSLVIDGFLMRIREELQKKGRLDAKAIILHPLGDWEIKEEEELTGEQGDGSGRCHTPQSRLSTRRQSTPQEVIEIDDG